MPKADRPRISPARRARRMEAVAKLFAQQARHKLTDDVLADLLDIEGSTIKFWREGTCPMGKNYDAIGRLLKRLETELPNGTKLTPPPAAPIPQVAKTVQPTTWEFKATPYSGGVVHATETRDRDERAVKEIQERVAYLNEALTDAITLGLQLVVVSHGDEVALVSASRGYLGK